MLVGCVAVWSRGGVVVLAPNAQPETLQRVAKSSGCRQNISDSDSVTSVDGSLVLTDALAPDTSPVVPFFVEPERVVVELYTSGTTGEHQRIQKRARQLFLEAETLYRTFGVGPEHVVIGTVPAHHLYGLLFTLLVPFISEASFVRSTPFQPSDVLQSISEHGATELVTVPTHLSLLLNAHRTAPSLKRIVSSGAVLSPDVAERAVARFGVPVFDVLGSTESGGIGLRRPEQSLAYRPLPGVETSVSEDGRLQLRSPFLEEPNTVQTMNDHVRLTPQGFVFEGRTDGIVKVSGKRVALQEMEQRARQVAGVTDATCLAVDSDGLRDKELWLLVATQDTTLNAEHLRKELSRSFDATVLPRRYRFVSKLPHNDMGKLERDAVLKAFGRPSPSPDA